MDWGLVFNAITLGAIYALIAVGYTMVYGIIQLINFAHGEVFMIGTFVGLLLVVQNVPLAVAVLIAMVACLVLGVVLDFSAYLPLRRKHPFADSLSLGGLSLFSLLAIAYFEVARRAEMEGAALALAILLGAIPFTLFFMAIMGLVGKLGRPKASVQADRLSALITAIGMSLALQTIAQLVWGADFYHFPEDRLPDFFNDTALLLGDSQLKGNEVATWVVTLTMMIGLNYLVANTKIGKAMRACAQDKDTASLMGVNVNYVIAITFMIGSAMAAIAGILYAINVGGNIYFRMGYYPGVIAFAAAVLGGIGSIRGAVAGGFIIGAVQSVGEIFAAEYSFAFAFGLMIIVILFRPWGLFGKAEATRA